MANPAASLIADSKFGNIRKATAEETEFVRYPYFMTKISRQNKK